MNALRSLPPVAIHRATRLPVVLRGMGAINVNQQLTDAANYLVQDLNANSPDAFKQPVTSVSTFQSLYNAAGGGAAMNPATGKPGLQVDGLYGPQTAAALQEVLDASNTGSNAPDPIVPGHQGGVVSGGGGGGGSTAITPALKTTTSQASMIPGWLTQNITLAGAQIPWWVVLLGGAGLLYWAMETKTKRDRRAVRAGSAHRRMGRRGRRRNPFRDRKSGGRVRYGAYLDGDLRAVFSSKAKAKAFAEDFAEEGSWSVRKMRKGYTTGRRRNPIRSRRGREKARKRAKRMVRDSKGRFVKKKGHRRGG